MCVFCFNECSGKHSASGTWLLLARTTVTAKLRHMTGTMGIALFSTCQMSMNYQDVQIAALLCSCVQVHERIMVMPCMEVD